MLRTLLIYPAVIGLLVANTVLLASRVGTEGRGAPRHDRPCATAQRPAAQDALREEMIVVDIHHLDLHRMGLRDALGLGPEDRILDVDASWIAGERSREFIDVALRRGARSARAIVLVH